MASKKTKNKKDAPVVTDDRFSLMHSAPNFQRIKSEKNKVVLDPRFAAVLKDERFRVPDSKYDKYGRRQSTKSAKDDLNAFYKIDETTKNDGESADEDFDEDDDLELADAEAELEASKEASSGL